MRYYNYSSEEVLKFLKSSSNGLNDVQVKERLKTYGINEIERARRLPGLIIFLRQFKNPLVLILIFAMFVSFLIRANLDGTVIAAILILNAIFGFFQEYRAERAMALLKEMAAPKAKVLRKGLITVINSKELVPGDIILLEAGDKVPADARILTSQNLQTMESALTGESTPVAKQVKRLQGELAVASQSNIVFASTSVIQGRARAVVIGIGMNTELGKIAGLVKEVKDEATPLQKKLAHLGKYLGIFVIFACLFVFLVGVLEDISVLNLLWKGHFYAFLIAVQEVFLAALSLAVSAIPEGLPAIVTIALALGVRSMLKRKALTRKMQAIESLGSTTVICSDKTGTLTMNEMTVVDVYWNRKHINVSGEGYFSEGKFTLDGKPFTKSKLHNLLKIAVNCNSSSLKPLLGDPTEIALLVLGEKGNVYRNGKDVVDEIPFSSEKKYMASTYEEGKKKITYVKGALEKVLGMCKYIECGGYVRDLNQRDKNIIIEEHDKMANSALRVLALAYGNKGTRDLVFSGLVGMIDRPRKEVKSAIKLCKDAGIRTIMITGDHLLTAEAIAKELGIEGKAVTGAELEKMTPENLVKDIDSIGVFARVDPSHKVRILEALQSKGEIVAMTGDGVNDAPALKKADVGVAMSITGTDVAREASDVVLLDDNFATIVRAIKEGRTIYDNIRKFVRYLLAVNFSEIFLIMVAILIKLPLPLLPLQILWINLATDSLPALSLGADPSEKDVMKRKPRNPSETILHRGLPFLITVGALAFATTFIVFLISFLWMKQPLEQARTMALSTSIMFELFFVFTMRSEKKTIFELGALTNKYMVGAVLISIVLHLVLIYTPLSIAFGLASIGIVQWLIVLGFSILGFAIFELKKVFVRA